MTPPQDVQQFIGRTAVDSEGNKVGKIGQVYLDERSGLPLWVTVATGMLGTSQSFAPIDGSGFDGDQVRLAVSKDLVKDAPSIDEDGRIGASEQEALYRHYADDLGRSQAAGRTGCGDGDGLADGTAGARGRDTSGPVTDDAMTRSEEQLRVGTETVEGGRARLRKYVVTENVSTTVPVSHEEVHVEREPITDANRDAALSGEPISQGRARGGPAGGTARSGQGGRPGRARPAGHRDRDRGRGGQRDGPQGADRRTRGRRQPVRRGPLRAAGATSTGVVRSGERITACSTRDDTTDQPSVHPDHASAGAAPGAGLRGQRKDGLAPAARIGDWLLTGCDVSRCVVSNPAKNKPGTAVPAPA